MPNSHSDGLPAPWRVLAYPYLAAYEVFVGWVLGIELNHKASIGPGLKLFHGTALVIHGGAVIGAGSVVVKDVPAGAVVVGNPARQVEPSGQGSRPA